MDDNDHIPPDAELHYVNLQPGQAIAMREQMHESISTIVTGARIEQGDLLRWHHPGGLIGAELAVEPPRAGRQGYSIHLRLYGGDRAQTYAARELRDELALRYAPLVELQSEQPEPRR
jgi:hypothetical protein